MLQPVAGVTGTSSKYASTQAPATTLVSSRNALTNGVKFVAVSGDVWGHWRTDMSVAQLPLSLLSHSTPVAVQSIAAGTLLLASRTARIPILSPAWTPTGLTVDESQRTGLLVPA